MTVPSSVRALAVVCIAAVAVVVVVGQAGARSGNRETAAATPTRGGDLTILHYEPVTNTLNRLQEFYLGGIWPIEEINENLTFVDNTGRAIPVLATSWSVSKDQKTWTFHIRPGVKFSNGKALTAKDVVFSLRMLKKKEAIYGYLFAGIKSIDASGPLTVQIKMNTPNVALPAALANYNAAIVPNNFGGKSEAAYTKQPVGTGPFMLTSPSQHHAGSSIVLHRNPKYWRKGRPYLDSLTFKYVDSENQRVLQLKGGQAQLMDFNAPDQASVALEKGSGGVITKNLPCYNESYLLLSQTYKPLRDAHVRRAVAYSLDRAAIVKALLFGRGLPGTTYLNYRFKGLYAGNAGLPHSVSKAKSEIAQSAYKKGFNVTLLVTSGQEQLTQIIQQELATVGIHVNLKTVDVNALGQAESSGKYQMLIQPYGMVSGDPSELTGAIIDPKVLNSFFTGYKDPALTNAAKRAEAAFKPSQRSKLFAQVQRMQAKAANVITLFFMPQTFGMSEKLHGFDFGYGFNVALYDTWLAK